MLRAGAVWVVVDDHELCVDESLRVIEANCLQTLRFATKRLENGLQLNARASRALPSNCTTSLSNVNMAIAELTLLSSCWQSIVCEKLHTVH